MFMMYLFQSKASAKRVFLSKPALATILGVTLMASPVTLFGQATRPADNLQRINDSNADQLLVRPRAGVSDDVFSALVTEHHAEILDSIPQINTFVLHVPPN